MSKGEYHSDKYAIETTNSVGTVRVFEMFGKSAAESTAKQIRDHWAGKPEYSVAVIQIQNENGSL